MQDYYNTIPSFSIGGLIAQIAKTAGRAKIQANANRLSKLVPELSKLLSKLAKSQKDGTKLSEEEVKKLVTLAQNYRRSTIPYQNRRVKINEQIANLKKPKVYQNSPQQVPTKPVEQPNPIPGTTLSARWQQAKTWMNNHPKTTIGVPLLALGTGPGRYVTGNAVKAIQSNPENWFNDTPSQSGEASDFIVINGTKIPIKRSAEGYFVPATQDNAEATSAGGDSIDQTLAGITNENLGGTPQQQQGNMPVVDQQAINDLFEDDQWQ